jgi:plasmid stability protein
LLANVFCVRRHGGRAHRGGPPPDPSPLSEAGVRALQFCQLVGCRGRKGVGRREQSLYAINALNDIIDCMASITIRKLPEATKRRLRIRAARNGRSMEQEAREIIKTTVAQPDSEPVNIGEAIRQIFAPLGGVELKIPPRRGKIREISFE